VDAATKTLTASFAKVAFLHRCCKGTLISTNKGFKTLQKIMLKRPLVFAILTGHVYRSV
jgi:hypothetical protein